MNRLPISSRPPTPSLLPPVATAGLAGLLATLVVACATTGARDFAAGTPTPNWLWTAPDAEAEEVAWFRREFTLDDLPAAATITTSADNELELWLNGELVLEHDDWMRAVDADVLALLAVGDNVLEARCANHGGTAGFWLGLTLRTAAGDEETLITDASWSVRAEREGADALVHVRGPLGIEPWGATAGSGTVLAADELEVPAGFVAELLYEVPSSRGSWVSICFGPDGSAYVSEQRGSLYRVRVPTPEEHAEGRMAEVEPLDVELGDAQGLLWAFDALYVVVNSSKEFQSGLYRLRDTDGDGAFEEPETLSELDGHGEHGPHAVLLGPDGESLYVLGGNHTALPGDTRDERDTEDVGSGLAASRVPRHWDEDELGTRIEDPRGHALGIRAPGGWVAITDREGSAWELHAAGFRNAYDAAFDPEGELFVYDSDMEWDVGMPWYRAPRVLHAVSGADFGWRSGTGKWPDDYADTLPSVLDTDVSSPTGVVFGTESSFPYPWRESLFIADWAYGTLYAVQLEERGASFVGTDEPFVRGEPLPLTDLAFGPDGALYFTTGGRGLASGLYRVRWDGASAAVMPPERTISDARVLRRRLEALHRGEGSNELLEIAWAALDHEDRHVRYAARVGIEHQPVETWRQRALDEERPRAAVQAWIALARAGAEVDGPRIVDRWLELDVVTDPTLTLAALRALQLALLRGEPVPYDSAQRLAPTMESLVAGDDERVAREAARMLPQLGTATGPRSLLAVWREAPTHAERIALALTLREQEAGWTDAQRRELLEWFAAEIPEVEGGASARQYVETIRDELIETFDDDTRVALAAWIPEPEEVEEVEAAAVVQTWTRADIEPHLGELASGRRFDSGQVAFRTATCLLCHRMGDEGGNSGPDLTGVGSRFGPEELLTSLMEPSKDVSDQYELTEVRTHDEELHVGRLVERADGWIVLRTPPPAEEDIEIEESEVADERPHPLSAMPVGLIDVLTEDEVLDLMAYVLAGGDPDAPAFRPAAE